MAVNADANADTAFAGFGEECRSFLAELAANNNKSWFQENRDRYEQELMDPAIAFVATLGPSLQKLYPAINYGTQRNGSGSIMRIHRDIRFSADKRPYKENLGIVFWIGTGKKVEQPCFYFHLDPGRAFFYAGQHMFPKQILARYREAVDDSGKGQALADTLQEMEGLGLTLYEEPAYKRVPQGFPKDHARADLLRYAGMGVATEVDGKTLASDRLLEVCSDVASKAHPLMEWLLALPGR